jgi:hypothetical protein
MVVKLGVADLSRDLQEIDRGNNGICGFAWQNGVLGNGSDQATGRLQ